MNNGEKGRLFVISGPSGAGKSTLVARLLERLDNVYFSVSATTREPRRGETDGKDYFFVSRDKFRDMIAGGELLEYAEYVGNYYGTPAGPCDEMLSRGRDVILDIETQGAAQVMKLRPDAISMFIFPKSFEQLEERLRLRKTDSEEKILARLAQARIECRRAEMYKYIIINDRVETAADEVEAVITAEKCRTVNRLHYLTGD
ncbi:MAG: guanylate kinase [Oscillospiraceae bacterium]|nr:guanylate kinase [Oscillospiraceae bacterium]